MVWVLYLNHSRAQSLDERLLSNIHLQRNTRLDGFFKTSSSSAVPVSLLVPMAFFAKGSLGNNKNEIRTSVVMVSALALNTGLTYALKYAINRPRPYDSNPALVPINPPVSPSFPSGHTSLAFTTATNITLTIPKWYTAVPAYIWATSVGYARLHMGVHYPSDVLAGAVLGIGSAWISHRTNLWLKNQSKQKAKTEL